MGVSDEILKRTADSYRRIRNTARFLLANLNGFDPATDRVEPSRMLELDRWVVDRAFQLQEEIVRAYRDYQFHLIYQKVHNFCVTDLGGFYLDVIKDRQYTTPRESLARRSGQTALHHIAEALVRWLAPILSFTADEIWQHLPGERGATVFTEQWYGGLFALDATDPLGPRLLGAGARGAHGSRQAPRAGAQGRRDRLGARCRGRRLLRRAAAGAAREAGGRAAVRAHHLVRARAPDGRAPGRRRADRRCGRCGAHHAVQLDQVRALLAPPRGRRRERGAPGAVRALRDERGRAGRGAEVRLAIMHRLRWLILSLLVIAADQATKLWVLAALQPREVIPVVPAFNLTLVFNEGAAFSFLAGAGGWQRWFFVGVAVAVSTVLIVWLWRLKPEERLTAAGLSLVAGGAVGNLIDRLAYGRVVDFLDFYWRAWHWPAFNVADSAITVGVGLLLLEAFLPKRE